jgi:hypothetical protein
MSLDQSIYFMVGAFAGGILNPLWSKAYKAWRGRRSSKAS